MKECTSGTGTLRLNVCPVVSPLGIYDAELDCLRLVKLFDDALDVFSVAVVPCSENIRFESRDSSLKLGSRDWIRDIGTRFIDHLVDI